MTTLDKTDALNLLLSRASAVTALLLDNGQNPEGFESTHEIIIYAVDNVDSLLSQAIKVLNSK